VRKRQNINKTSTNMFFEAAPSIIEAAFVLGEAPSSVTEAATSVSETLSFVSEAVHSQFTYSYVKHGRTRVFIKNDLPLK
jgi:hypothetical protein